jgi:hypothetical protein
MSACVWKIYGSAGNIEVLYETFTFTLIYALSGVIHASAYFRPYALMLESRIGLTSFGPANNLL